MGAACQHEEFLATSESTFWAPKPHCEALLSDEDRAFSNNMKMPERAGGISSFGRTTLQIPHVVRKNVLINF